MIVLGLVLLVLLVAFTVLVATSNPDQFEFYLFRAHFPVTTLGVFLTGAAAMAVLIIALLLLRIGIRRRGVKRKELKATKSAGTTSPAVSGRGSGQPAPPPDDTRQSSSSPPPSSPLDLDDGSSR